MAELNVQPKKRGSVWPWLLLALGVIALIYYLMRGRNDDMRNEHIGSGSDSTSQSLKSNPAGRYHIAAAQWI